MRGAEGRESNPPLWVGGISLAFLGFLGMLVAVKQVVVGVAVLMLLAVLLFFWHQFPRWGGALLLLIQFGIGFQIAPAFVFEARGFYLFSLLLIASTPGLLLPFILRRSLLRWRDVLPYALFLLGGVLTHLQTIWSPRALVLPPQAADVFLIFVVLSSICVLLLVRSGTLRVRSILRLMTLGTLLMATVVLLHGIFIMRDFTLSQERLGVQMPIGPNHLAFSLDMFLPVGMGLAFSETNRNWRRLFIAASGVMGVVIVLTGTRGSLGTELLILIWLVVRFRKERWFWGALFIGTLLIAGVVVPRVAARLVETSPRELMSHLGRIWLLEAAYQVLRVKGYVFGSGFDSFRIIKYQYGFPHWYNPGKTMSSHNTYLEYWIGWGLPSLVGYFSLLVLGVRSAWLGVRRNSDLAVGIMIGILGYSFHGFVDSSLVLFPLTFAFWILVALALSTDWRFEHKECRP